MAAQSPEQPAADKAVPFPAAQKSKQLPVLLNAIENQTAGQRRSALAAEHQAKKKAAATYAQLATHAAVPVQQLRATQLSEAAAKPVQALAKASTTGTMVSHVLTDRNLALPPLVHPLLPAAPMLAAAAPRGLQMKQTGVRAELSSPRPLPAAHANTVPLSSSAAHGTARAASVETKSGRSVRRPAKFEG